MIRVQYVIIRQEINRASFGGCEFRTESSQDGLKMDNASVMAKYISAESRLEMMGYLYTCIYVCMCVCVCVCVFACSCVFVCVFCASSLIFCSVLF